MYGQVSKPSFRIIIQFKIIFVVRIILKELSYLHRAILRFIIIVVIRIINGIEFISSNYNSLSYNTCNLNVYSGIDLFSASNNTVENNYCLLNHNFRFFLESSYNNSVKINDCTSNFDAGIRLTESNNNTVEADQFNSNGEWGICLEFSNSTIINGNNCSLNTDYGIELTNSNFCLIWGNNFMNNGWTQALGDIYSTPCQWYVGQTGNYYSDYLIENPTALNNGTVWDIPYIIYPNYDLYPLVNETTIDLNTLHLTVYSNPQPSTPLLNIITPNP